MGNSRSASRVLIADLECVVYCHDHLGNLTYAAVTSSGSTDHEPVLLVGMVSIQLRQVCKFDQLQARFDVHLLKDPSAMMVNCPGADVQGASNILAGRL